MALMEITFLIKNLIYLYQKVLLKFTQKKYATIGVITAYNNEIAFATSVKEKCYEHWGWFITVNK